MSMRTSPGRLAAAAGTMLALLVALFVPTGKAVAAESLSVNLGATTGPATGIGEGFLYGISEDGTQPADQFLQPLGINAFRGGGWFSGGWIKDGYQFGSATQADINSIIAEARRLTQPPYHVQYQVLLTDTYGLNGGQPSNTMYPCDNGSCSNWASFIDSVVGALQASGLKFSYDIDNEPDISVFWTRGMNSPQYFQMWDTAYREIRRVAPGATIVGPSLAFTPLNSPGEWSTWLAHVKSAGTAPDMISDHLEGDGNDPVAVGQAIDNDLAAAGLPRIPLSANEYQPQDQQSAGQTAWYLARLAQSGYTNAMRGNWNCCVIPNLTGVLTQSGGAWTTTGNWWVYRSYADLTGSLVSTSGEVNTTAITAAEDSTAKRAVAIVGDENGFTGAASVTFSGMGSVPWLAGNGSVHVTVDRIPDQAPLSAPSVVLDENVSVSSGSIAVPLTFAAAHDAFAIYVTPASSTGGGYPSGYHQLVVANDGLCADVFGDSTAAGAAIDQWPCNGQANQRFQFVPASGGSGYGQLQAQNSGDDITVSGSSSVTGTPDIVQEPANGSTTSQWLPVRQSDGSYEFQNQASGSCLDVTGASSSHGQQLDQWPCKNALGTNQDFTPN